MSEANKPHGLRWLWRLFAVMTVYCVAAQTLIHPALEKAGSAPLSEDASYVSAEEAVYGSGLYIDGAFVAACSDGSAVLSGLDAALQGLAAAYGVPAVDSRFENEIRTVEGEYPEEDFVDSEGLASLLGVSGSTVVFRVVDAGGETLDVDLRVGTKRTEVCSEVVARPVETSFTDLLPAGESMTVTEGSDGLSQNAYELTYLNGELTGKELTAAAVILEPVAKEQLCGTDSGETLLSASDGFSLPYNGIVTSPYGYRSLWGGTELHDGIDYANHGGCYGDPICAAQDGIVSFAGWKGAYGNAVVIDHTKELSTLYGHCSKLLVKEGQYVRKGQIIALIGNTGKVTGAHLHFSVIKDGVFCNPAPYLN